MLYFYIFVALIFLQKYKIFLYKIQFNKIV